MRALFAQGDGFLKTCVDLMGRVMNTVPAGVHLSEPISAAPLKPVNVTFDIDHDGQLRFSGKLRVLTPPGETAPTSLNLQVANHSTSLIAEANTGSSVFGRRGNTYGVTSYFPFSVSGVDFRSATSFTVESSYAPPQSFDISSDTFIVPSLTTLSAGAVNMTIAIAADRVCEDVTLNIAYPVPQAGTMAPRVKIAQSAVSQVSLSTFHTLCSGILPLADVVTGLVTIQILEEGHAVDTYLLNGGAAGW